jgi:hypothetical protein
LLAHLYRRTAGIGVRREKAALSSGCETHPAIRSSRKQSELLENIEAELASEKLEASEERHLRRRVELIHWLLASRTIKESAKI